MREKNFHLVPADSSGKRTVLGGDLYPLRLSSTYYSVLSNNFGIIRFEFD